jgi:hypothetical protein
MQMSVYLHSLKRVLNKIFIKILKYSYAFLKCSHTFQYTFYAKGGDLQLNAFSFYTRYNFLCHGMMMTGV